MQISTKRPIFYFVQVGSGGFEGGGGKILKQVPFFWVGGGGVSFSLTRNVRGGGKSFDTVTTV